MDKSTVAAIIYQDKELWCCVGGVKTDVSFINRVDGLTVNWPPYTDSRADVSSVSPSSERIKELSVVGVYNSEQWNYSLWWKDGNGVENKNELVE